MQLDTIKPDIAVEQNVFFEPKTEQELSTIRHVATIVSKILDKAKRNIKVGMSTKDIEDIVRDEIKKHNCQPAFLGYRGYPATSCISIDSELVHGIPSKTKKFAYGQVVSIDIGIIHDGFYGDAATTVLITEKKNTDTSNKIWNLLNVAYDALIYGVRILKENIRVGDLSNEIQTYIEKNNFSVIREYVGHTIGRQLHEKPDIPNFGMKGEGPRFYDGQVICIEPMVSIGNFRTKVLNDGWTVVMQDGSLCAHYEHMVLITKTGYEILTDTNIIKPEKIN